MDDSWSWDGSLVSLPASSTASTASLSPARSASLVASIDAHDSLPTVPPAAWTGDSSPYGRPSRGAAVAVAPNSRPPSPSVVGSLDSAAPPAPPSDSASSRAASAPPPVDSKPAPLHSHPYPFSSILLSDLSPPASPSPSVSSFPRSHSRVASRGRTRTRRGSASSTVSTDGSLHAATSRTGEDSGTSSSAEDSSGGGDRQGLLVMPSLTLETRARMPSSTSSHHGKYRSRGRSADALRGGWTRLAPIRLVVLGKTAHERTTLATLLATDGTEDDNDSDMSYSFLSTKPQAERPSPPSDRPPATSSPAFVQLASCGSTTALFHPESDAIDLAEIASTFIRPLERFEAILNRTYPATDSLADFVSTTGVGEYDACLFLFSSPPLPAELASARTVSHLVPILPVLVLPPSPTSKPQKTTALSNAMMQQLDSAGVQWIAMSAFEPSQNESGPRSSPQRSQRDRRKLSGLGGGPLTMLPNDLFVQHPLTHPSLRNLTSSVSTPFSSASSFPPTSYPSPTSDGPRSLTSSQELLPPFSPTFTDRSDDSNAADRRGFDSSRTSSIWSDSPSSRTRADERRRAGRSRDGRRGTEPTMQDLNRLSRVLSGVIDDDPEQDGERAVQGGLGPSSTSRDVRSIFRRIRALSFLEWREVEVAARGIEPTSVESLPIEWQEKEVGKVEGLGGEQGKGVRRALDFSKRVAERRSILKGRRSPRPDRRSVEDRFEDEVDREADVLDNSSDEDDRGEPGGIALDRRTTLGNSSSSQEPTTPKPGFRYLPTNSAAPLSTPTPTSSSNASSGSGSDGSPSSGSNSSNRRHEDPDSLSTSSYFPPYPPLPPLSASTVSIPSSSSTTDASASSASLLMMRSSDPFHFPALLHLVGLNLRLALFPFSTAALRQRQEPASLRPVDETDRSDSKRADSSGPLRSTGCGHGKHPVHHRRSWWTTIAVVGIVFVTGVTVGVHLVDSGAPFAAPPRPSPSVGWR
ncbi:hypothetical protein JCM10212_006483 [Sporobolomyces blumeae]